LPRSIATFEAFENAMTLDIAMGGSTNTVLHLLAMAQEGEVPFTMADIDRLSRHVPHLCKVAPSTPDVHVEDVHRAGGIFGILGELDRGGLIHRAAHTVHCATLGEAIDHLDVKRAVSPCGEAVLPRRAGRRAHHWSLQPVRPLSGTRSESRKRHDSRHGTRLQHRWRPGVLFGNIATDGCIVKTAGVDAAHLTFEGPARIFEARKRPPRPFSATRSTPATWCDPLRRPQGRAGNAGDALSHQLPQIQGTGQGLRADYRRTLFRRVFGLSIGHISPEAAEGGALALVEEGDRIEIDIPKRVLRVNLTDEEIARRRKAMEAKGSSAWKPVSRKRKISKALQAYAALTTSAARGAVRDLKQIQK
jgi:dihydroxy-acid dehydratase